MKIAIIGTGIAGNTAAHRLHPRHDITVFEAAGRIGGHTHTVRVDLDGETLYIDTGFIVFNEPNYPHFTKLLDELGIATQPTSMSFSVRCDRTGLEYNGTNLDKLFVQRSNVVSLRFLRMVRDIVRFGREAPVWLADADDRASVDAWTAERGYSRGFVEHYLVPLGAALWSCPPATFRQFSMKFVIDFLHNHAMLRVAGRPVWRVVQGGSHRYVEQLTRPFAERIRLQCAVHRVRRTFDHVVIESDAGSEHFDHVIFACHADQALKLLADPSPTELALLRAFPYQRNDVVLHTDTSVLPRRRKAWASWNARLLADDGRAAITYNMNMLQDLRSKHTYCVTLNHTAHLDPAKIIRRMTYDHPLYMRGRDAARARHADLVNHHHTSYCGAYWGFGFHEDGVRSALAVCQALTHQREVAHA